MLFHHPHSSQQNLFKAVVQYLSLVSVRRPQFYLQSLLSIGRIPENTSPYIIASCPYGSLATTCSAPFGWSQMLERGISDRRSALIGICSYFFILSGRQGIAFAKLCHIQCVTVIAALINITTSPT